MHYPQIHSPIDNIDLEQELYLLNPAPNEPRKPVAPVIIEPKTGITSLMSLLAVLSIIGFIGIIATNQSTDQEGYITIIVCIFIFIIAVYSITRAIKNDKVRVSYYNKQVEFYNQEFEKYTTDYKKYLLRFTEYTNESNRLKNPSERHTEVDKIIKSKISLAAKPKSITQNYKKGVTEDYFIFYLLKYFKKNIYRNLTIQTFQAELGIREPERYYIPDFVYYNENSGMCIDIEIDEPYTGEDGRPIHYEGSNDDTRDNFFIYNFWFVIRFSERQVFLFPNECCKRIAELINSIFPESIRMEAFSNIQELEIDKQWSEQEAIDMAIKSFRNSYLTQEYGKKLKYEHESIQYNVETPENAISNIEDNKLEDNTADVNIDINLQENWERQGKQLFKQAMQLLKANNFNDAFDRLLEGYNLLTCDCLIGDWFDEDVVTVFQSAKTDNCELYKIEFLRAFTLFYSGRLEASLSSINCFIYFKHDQEIGYYLKGKILANLKRDLEAIDCLKTAIEIKNTYRTLYRIGRFKEQNLCENGVPELYKATLQNLSSSCCCRQLQIYSSKKKIKLNANSNEFIVKFFNEDNSIVFGAIYSNLWEKDEITLTNGNRISSKKEKRDFYKALVENKDIFFSAY